MSGLISRISERFRTEEMPLLKVGILSLAVNLSLVVLKVTLSVVTGSLAMKAEAVHSTVDIFASIAVITGLLISTRKSKKFPYGLYKVENLVSLVISLLLFVATYEIVSEALTGESVMVEYGGWVLGIVAVMILVPFLFSRYEKKMGLKYNSPSLIADASHFKTDVLSASVVFFAVLGQYFGIPLDKYAAGIVAVFIGLAGWSLLSNSMRVILDASVSQETLEDIRAVITAEPAVVSLKELTGRNSGRYIFVEAVVSLRLSDLEKAHFTCNRIEEKIRASVANVDRVLIHYEPSPKTVCRYAVALDDDKREISQHFGASPFFAILDISLKDNKEIHREIIANPCLEIDKGKGIKVAEVLLDHKTDKVIVAESLSHKGPGYALADAGVEVISVTGLSLDDFINRVTTGQEY